MLVANHPLQVQQGLPAAQDALRAELANRAGISPLRWSMMVMVVLVAMMVVAINKEAAQIIFCLF